MRIHRHRARQSNLHVQKFRMNEKIAAPEVRVVDDKGEALGILETSAAIAIARAKELDLVEVSPKAEPPVCKILDYGAFKYQKEKEARKQKAQSKEVETKGIRLTFRIGAHDFDVRLAQAGKFLDRGDKVHIELPLRGREKAHRDVAEEVIKRFITTLQATYTLRIEQNVTYQGGKLSAIVTKN